MFLPLESFLNNLFVLESFVKHF